MEPGSMVGDYEMVRPLGSGGMAQVWLARNPRMNRQFAIKFILDQFVGNHEIHDRFHDEAWRQSGLQHANIVPVENVLSVNGRDYIVMRYVVSGLDKRLHELRGRPLPIPEAIDITLQLLDALQYTHSFPPPEGPLIHRDIKPSNILLTGNGTVQLTDFGIALATNAARKTMSGQVLGTAFYMSPEQIKTPGLIDTRADIYSAGCVLYEMFAGRPPFGSDGDTDFSIQHDHCHRMPDPLRKSNATIPERFEWIVFKALAKDVGYRFQTCQEMGVALISAYRDEGLPMELLPSYRGGLTAPPVDRASKRTIVELPVPSFAQPPVRVAPPSIPQATAAPPPPSVIPIVRPPLVKQRTPWYKRPSRILALLAILAIVGGLAWWLLGGETPPMLTIEGSTSVGDDLAPALAEQYLSGTLHASDVKRETEIKTAADGSRYTVFNIHGESNGKPQSIKIVSNGSKNAFMALTGKTADLGMSSRPFSADDPRDLAYLTSSNQYEHVIALDGVAVVVNPSNPIQSLTMAQLSGIFTGKIGLWTPNGARIHCYGRTKSSGTFEMFRNNVVGSKGKLSAIQDADQFAEGKEVVSHVAQDVNGIGYVTFTQAAGLKVVPISDQGTQPLVPNSRTVSTEDYRLTRRLYFYEPTGAGKAAADFISFAMGEDGQKVVDRNHFVPLMPQAYNDPAPADSPANYRSAVSGLLHLGLSFRFTSGSGAVGNNYVLDNLAKDNLLRLKAFLDAHPGARVTLLGFTDNVGNPIGNLRLSQQRAQGVATELNGIGIPSRVEGMGAEMPVATNDTVDGKAKNRRVEVWVTPN